MKNKKTGQEAIQGKILNNWEKGYFTVLQRDNDFYIVSTKSNGNCYRNSGLYPTVNECKKYIGSYSGKLEYIKDSDRYIGTIHPSELMGDGFNSGDKVIVLSNLEEECEKFKYIFIEAVEESIGKTFEIMDKVGNDYKLSNGYIYPPSALAPYYGKKK